LLRVIQTQQQLRESTESSMQTGKSMVVGWCLLGALAAGCAAGRDVEVSGQVSAASSVTVGNKLVIDFIDVVGDGGSAEQSIAHTTELQRLGEFKETVLLEGDQVLIRAVDDTNGDGKCSQGEAWGEVHAAIENGKAEAAMLMLGLSACPEE
jgi:hypothetical protein